MRSIFGLLGGKPAQRGGFEPSRRHHLYDRDGGGGAGAFAGSRVSVTVEGVARVLSGASSAQPFSVVFSEMRANGSLLLLLLLLLFGATLVLCVDGTIISLQSSAQALRAHQA
ncbi:unnamed protein product [Ectocarpus sp. 12 AP-2014]